MTILGCSPTLVRALIPHGEPEADLSSLRVFVTTGEPWNPGPYRWLFERIGGAARPHRQHHRRHRGRRGASWARRIAEPIEACSRRRPALSAWRWTWSTPTGSSLVGTGEVGELVCRKPFPGMTRGFWGDPERYLETYWRRFPGDLDARRLGLRRRGRLLVPARPLGRHAEHRRQADRAGRDRVGRGRASGRDRGGRRRSPARDQGRGGVGLLRAAHRTGRPRPRRWPT